LKKKLLILGSTGMVGSSLLRIAKKKRIYKILNPNRKKLDLKKFNQIVRYLKKFKPDVIVNCAAMVGGVHSNNTKPAQFIYNNLVIQTNLIHAAYKGKIKKLIFLGSSCIYPRNSKQPIKEDYLLSGYLEKTNEPYAIAKIAGIKMCEAYRREYGCNFISVMPTNLYGINDNFDKYDSHVMPALIRKFAEAKESNANEVEIWGTGKPKREFLFVDDLAEAILTIDKKYNDVKPINVGFGEDISIKKLSYKLKKLFKFNGKIKFNKDFPDGTPRKLLDVKQIEKLGWRPKTSLEKGLIKTMNWYKKNYIKNNYTKNNV
jgi:GDP-L-fucose synthase